MNDLDKDYVHTMRGQAVTNLTQALNFLYGAQRAIRELTYPGQCQDPGWTDSGEGIAGMSLLAQTIDMTWAVRSIAETIADKDNL